MLLQTCGLYVYFKSPGIQGTRYMTPFSDKSIFFKPTSFTIITQPCVSMKKNVGQVCNKASFIHDLPL